MPQHQYLKPAEEELAAALGALAPAEPNINRDRMLFLAGRAAERKSAGLWRGVSAGLAACLVAALSVQAWWSADRWTPTTIEPVRPVATVKITAPPPQLISSPAPALTARLEGSYVQLRNAVLTRGMEALPPLSESSPSVESTPTDAMIALTARRRRMKGELMAMLNFLQRRNTP
jgi:hypothetical protein